MKAVFIRCDGNDLNGYGHLSRCVNIARGISERHQNFSITFIGNYSPKAVALIEMYHFRVQSFLKHDAESTFDLIAYIKDCDYFILDSYKISQRYIDELSGHSFKFCLIVDGSNLLNCSKADLVINYTINGQDFDYKSKEQALGLKYFPVKPELKKVREQNLLKANSNAGNILLMIGGHDVYAVGIKLLKILDNSVSNKKITFISSVPLMEDITVKNNELHMLPFVEKIEAIYQEADLTITGGGLSKYESGYCCIPNASIPQNINEYNDSLHFEANKLTRILGVAYDFNEAGIQANIPGLLAQKKMIHSDLFHTDSLNNLVNVILN